MEIGPPAHVPLLDNDWPFFHAIIEEFAKADWTPHSTTMAAFLARTMGHLEAEQRTLFREGVVLERDDGSVYSNLRTKIVDNLMSQTMAIRRSMGLTGRAKMGGTRDVKRLREANRGIEQAASGGDDLLA